MLTSHRAKPEPSSYRAQPELSSHRAQPELPCVYTQRFKPSRVAAMIFKSKRNDQFST